MLNEIPIAYYNSGVVQRVADTSPLPAAVVGYVSQGNPRIVRWAFSGSVAGGATNTLHGGAAGSPTISGAVGFRFVILYLQYKLASGTSAPVVRVRRRALTEDGIPYTVWSDYVDTNLTAVTSDTFAGVVLANSLQLQTPTLPADELEVSLQNPSGNGTLTWQAVIVGVN